MFYLFKIKLLYFIKYLYSTIFLNIYFFQFAANYARDKLIANINQKVIELKTILAGKEVKTGDQGKTTMDEVIKKEDNEKKEEKLSERKKSCRKIASASLTDDCMKESIKVSDPELLNKLESISPITRKVSHGPDSH